MKKIVTTNNLINIFRNCNSAFQKYAISIRSHFESTCELKMAIRFKQLVTTLVLKAACLVNDFGGREKAGA